MSATPKRFGCVTCFPANPEAAYANSRKLDELARLVDESHVLVAIRACPKCGQRFVYTFTEMIDWSGGDDPQRCAMVPITPAEADDLIAQGEKVSQTSIESTSDGRPVLVMDF